MPFKIAAICTIYYQLSHADVIITRWLEPHPRDVESGFVPQTEIAALHIVQRPAGDPAPDPAFIPSPSGRDPVVYDQRYDIGRVIAHTYGVPLAPTVRDALTLGGDTLAVDAVLLIGEHGDYPRNEFDQQLYPRKELFDAIIAVFRESGRAVPLFCDKHLSWNMDWAREMAQTVRELRIPFLAGSSLSLAGLAHDLGIADGAEIAESLGLFHVHPESYGFHSLELVQSVIERRAGGEHGIRSVRAYRGEGVWAALDAGALPQDLLAAALAAAPTKAGDMRENCRHGQPPAAFVLEHMDGHRSTHILLDGHVEDFAVAVRMPGAAGIRASRAATSGGADDWRALFVPTFAVLDREIQRMFLTGATPVPLERTLLTTLTVATWMQQALPQPGKTILTPHLNIAYQ